MAQEKVALKDAPTAVQMLISEKYAKFKLAGVKFNQKKWEYTVELEKGERTISLVLDTNATVLSKTKGRIYSYDGTEAPPNRGVPHNEMDN